MTLKLITGEKNIMAAAKALAKVTKETGEEIHRVLCSALAHIREHKNTTLLDHVFENLHGSAPIKYADAWVRRFSNLQAKDEDGKRSYRKPKSKALVINLDAAMANPYWSMPEVQQDNRQVTFDAEARLISFMNSSLRSVAEHKTKQDEKRVMTIVGKVADLAHDLKIPLDRIEVPEGIELPKPLAKIVKEDTAKAEKQAAANANKPKAEDANEPQQAAA